MEVVLSPDQTQQLQQAQRQARDRRPYVQVTVLLLLLLGKSRSVASVAKDLGLYT